MESRCKSQELKPKLPNIKLILRSRTIVVIHRKMKIFRLDTFLNLDFLFDAHLPGLTLHRTVSISIFKKCQKSIVNY